MHNKINALRITSITILTSLVLLFNGYSFKALAHDESSATEHHEQKFNAGNLILDHIGDAHDWHIAGHFSIPLPVILYSPAGLDIFSSARFNHGHDDYTSDKTNLTYRLHENKVVVVDSSGNIDESLTSAMYDLSITKNVAALFFSAFLMCWIFISIAKSYTRNPGKAPKGMQSLLEPIIIFLRDEVAITSIGKKHYKKFMPYLLTVFFLIFLNNLLGLVPIAPGGANLTGNIAITMSLAVFTFIITTVHGNRHYWRHIFAMPGAPVWVLFLLTPIEILGVFLKPFVLMVRLFANMTAGHIIALSFFSLIFIFGEIHFGAGIGLALFSTVFTVFMMVLELLVAFIQAYVFTLLSAVYFGSAVAEDHHHEEAHAH